MAEDLGTVMGGPVVAIHPRSAGLLNNAAKRSIGLSGRPTEGPIARQTGYRLDASATPKRAMSSVLARSSDHRATRSIDRHQIRPAKPRHEYRGLIPVAPTYVVW